ncbi:MAG: radical SAM protein [Ruminococcaceae bacterium]|nr:radical SAM protein [Oscillospiraceae bacterium]
MPDYRIIDVHNHIYPEKIVAKATDAIGDFYDIDMQHLGTGNELVEAGKKAGIEKFVVCSAATTPAQVQIINNFIAAECEKHPEFIGFGTLHPGFEDCGAEIARMKEMGLTGVKLHPDFQKFYIDDPEALPMFRAIRDSNMWLIVHLGDDRFEYSQPERMAKVLEEVPGLKLIGAHFGGYRCWESALDVYKPGTLYFDISSSMHFMSRELIFKFFERYGIESFFWGTDFPMWDHKEELELFFSLGLSEEDNRKILYENFAKAYGL